MGDRHDTSGGSLSPTQLLKCKWVIIPGQPVPFARPRPHFTKLGKYRHPKRYGAWLKYAGWTIAAANSSPDPPFSGEVVVEVVALFARPKGMAKKLGFNLMWRMGIPDLDNLMKAGLDAANGLLYGDDAQVVRLTGTKLYSKDRECGLMIHVAEAPILSVPWGLSFTPCECWHKYGR